MLFTLLQQTSLVLSFVVVNDALDISFGAFKVLHHAVAQNFRDVQEAITSELNWPRLVRVGVAK